MPQAVGNRLSSHIVRVLQALPFLSLYVNSVLSSHLAIWLFVSRHSNLVQLAILRWVVPTRKCNSSSTYGAQPEGGRYLRSFPTELR